VSTVNYLLLEALDTYAVVCDDVIETSRDPSVTLSAAAADIRRRLVNIFLMDSHSERPLHAGLSVCLSVCLPSPSPFILLKETATIHRTLVCGHLSSWSVILLGS